VWHASAAAINGKRMGDSQLRRIVRAALSGVGDRTRGEWEEIRPKAFHIRRRLSASEDLLVGPVVDVRGTLEAQERADLVIKQCPWFPLDMIREELGSR
jgi:hypothetical protein